MTDEHSVDGPRKLSRRRILGTGAVVAAAAATRPLKSSAAMFSDTAQAQMNIVTAPLAVPLTDDFNRPNSANLGVTPVGEAPWMQLRGTWDIASNRIRNLSGTDPIAVVDANTPDADVTLSVSSGGRDALIFRCHDANNWWRLSVYANQSSYQTCSNVYTHCKTCTRYYDDFTTIHSQWSACGCGSCGSCGNAHSSGGCGSTGSVCSQNCNTNYSYTYRVYLHRMAAGALSTVNFWSYSSVSSLRARTLGNQISVYRNGSLITTLSDATFAQATKFGAGRTQLGNMSSTALDNFNLQLAA